MDYPIEWRYLAGYMVDRIQNGHLMLLVRVEESVVG